MAEVRLPMWIGVAEADNFAPCRAATERLLGRAVADLGATPTPGASAAAMGAFIQSLG